MKALRLARKRRKTETIKEEQQNEGLGNHAVYAIMAAKSVAKKLHMKARNRNAAKWKSLLERCLKLDRPLQASPEIVELMKAGIPSQIRGDVWKVFLGVSKMKNKHPKDYYSTLRSNAGYVMKKFSSEKKLQDKKSIPGWFSQIQKDVPRTLHMAPKMKTEAGRESLFRVLVCYYYRNPQAVGYCQGMNLVAGGLLSLMDEEDAFWALVCVIESRIGYYTKSMAGLLVDQHVLDSLFSFYLPELYDHMNKLEVGVASFTTSWFICLFMETPVPYKICLGLWDYVFCYGDEMLFQISLAVLRKNKEEIMKTEDSGMLLVKTLKLGVNLEQFILSEVSGRIGELIQSIASLRRAYQIRVMDEHMTIQNVNIRERIKKRYQIKTDEEVQRLWKTFLSPSPWPILVQNCIPSMVWFSTALSKACYPTESKKWREGGLLSGFMGALFHLLDVHGTRQISFDNFVWLARILNDGSDRQRAKLAFRFFDVDHDRRVGKSDLMNGLKRIARMYGGRTKDSERRKFMLVNSFFFWYGETRTKPKNHLPEVDVKVKMPSKPFGFSIGQLKIGSTQFLEVSHVDGPVALQSNVEPGWKIMSINGKKVYDKKVNDMVDMCREAKLPTSIIFRKPAEYKMKTDDFTSCIEAFKRLEPRIGPLFFGTDAKDYTPPKGSPGVNSAKETQQKRTGERLVRWFRNGLMSSRNPKSSSNPNSGRSSRGQSKDSRSVPKN